MGRNRTSFYYGLTGESTFNLSLTRLVDDQYTHTPFYGWPRMTAYLRRRELPVNQKRGLRLVRLIGLAAICPKPKTTRVAEQVKIYAYLLPGLAIPRSDQVWRADITSPENWECGIRIQR